VHEPTGRTGLIEMLALALRSGGSVVYDGKTLDAWMERHAVTLEIASGPWGVELAFACPAAKLGELLERMGNLVHSPAYSPKEVEAARQKVLARLDCEQSDPAVLAERALRAAAFGPTSAWARCASASEVRAVTRSEILGFHRAHMGPGNLWVGLAVGGDATAARATLEKMLATLPRAGEPIEPAPPAFRTGSGPTVVLMDLPGVEQAEIRVAFAAPGVPAEAAALGVWLDALERSEGFDPAVEQARKLCGGLQFQELAPLRGLQPLGWAAGGRAPIAQVPAATAALIAAFSNDVLRSVPAEKLKAAHAVPVAPRSAREALAERVRDAAFDIAFEQRAKQAEEAAALPAEEVQRVVRSRLPARPPVVVVVGPARELVDALEQIGPVLVGSGVAEARGTPQALALRARLLEAMGGAEAWARLGGASLSGTFTDRGSEKTRKVRVWRDLLGRRVRVEDMPKGAPSTIVVTPLAGWSQAIGSVYDLPREVWEKTLFRERRQLMRVLHDLASDPRVEVSIGEAGRIEVRSGSEFVCWIELDSLDRPARLGYEEPDGKQGLFEYKEWIEEQGVAWPMEVVQPADGTIHRWKSVNAAPWLENSLFERPARPVR
jgi:hypothetical protein